MYVLRFNGGCNENRNGPTWRQLEATIKIILISTRRREDIKSRARSEREENAKLYF